MAPFTHRCIVSSDAMHVGSGWIYGGRKLVEKSRGAISESMVVAIGCGEGDSIRDARRSPVIATELIISSKLSGCPSLVLPEAKDSLAWLSRRMDLVATNPKGGVYREWRFHFHLHH